MQPDPLTVVITTYGGGSTVQRGVRQHVRLTCRPGTARVSVCARPPRSLPQSGACVQYLRAHAVGGTVVAFILGMDSTLPAFFAG